MTAPEQAMTLEERELVVNVLRNYHRDHAGDPEFGAWPQIAHRLAGRLAAPATQRDDTAELVEALYEALEKTEPFLEYLAQDGHEGALDLLEHVMYTLIKSSAARAALREAGVTDDA